MNTTNEEKKATAELLEKVSVYLNDNFHKFSDSNKIKIALEIFKRKMPTSPLIDNSTHNTEVNYVWQNDSNTLQPSTISEGNSRIAQEV